MRPARSERQNCKATPCRIQDITRATACQPDPASPNAAARRQECGGFGVWPVPICTPCMPVLEWHPLRPASPHSSQHGRSAFFPQRPGRRARASHVAPGTVRAFSRPARFRLHPLARQRTVSSPGRPQCASLVMPVSPRPRAPQGARGAGTGDAKSMGGRLSAPGCGRPPGAGLGPAPSCRASSRRRSFPIIVLGRLSRNEMYFGTL